MSAHAHTHTHTHTHIHMHRHTDAYSYVRKHLLLPPPPPSLPSLYRNLLRPSGVRLQAATMTVKVYRAEDLPQSKYSCTCWAIRMGYAAEHHCSTKQYFVDFPLVLPEQNHMCVFRYDVLPHVLASQVRYVV